jgi:hypothetical protein
MNKFWVIIFIGFVLFACSKDSEDDGWSYCTDCDSDKWAGTYSGTCSLYDGLNNLTWEDLIVNITISATGNDQLSVEVDVPSRFNMTVTGSLLNSYSISLTGTEKSLLGTMYIKENQLKFSGSAKTYRDKVGELELLKSVNFETIKN